MPGDDPTVVQTEPVGYDDEQDAWLDDDVEELPPRPRRRLLAPVPLALLAALLIACGFIGGVEVQKGQEGSPATGTGSGLAARFAALRRGAGAGAGGAAAAGGSGASGGGFGALRAAGGGAGAGGGVTTGEVAYVHGNTLYVTTNEGNTVKVTAAAGSKVTKTVSTKPSSINPGTTVVVVGSQAKDGSISASSISVGAGALGGALRFGGSGAAGTSSSGAAGGGTSSSGAGGGGEAPKLFGSG